MFTPRDFLWLIAIPGAIALVFSFLGLSVKPRALFAPLALAFSFLIAFASVLSNPWKFPPIIPAHSAGSEGWIPAIAILALVLGIVDALTAFPNWLRGLLVTIFTAAGLTLLLKFKFDTKALGTDAWTAAHGTIIIAAFSMAAFIWWVAIEDCLFQSPATSLVLIWLIACCVALVILLVASVDYGKFCLPLAAVGAGLLPATLWKRSSVALRGLSAVFVMLMTFLLAGVFYTSDLGLKLLLLLALPPVCIWLARWMPLRFKPWQRTITLIVATLIPLAIAISMAAVRFHQEQKQEQQEEAF